MNKLQAFAFVKNKLDEGIVNLSLGIQKLNSADEELSRAVINSLIEDFRKSIKCIETLEKIH